jgi:hypothetical protein
MTPPRILEPGLMLITLVPIADISSLIPDLEPSPIAIMVITAPTPMMIPNMVRNVLDLFKRMERHAIFTRLVIFMIRFFLIFF